MGGPSMPSPNERCLQDFKKVKLYLFEKMRDCLKRKAVYVSSSPGVCSPPVAA